MATEPNGLNNNQKYGIIKLKLLKNQLSHHCHAVVACYFRLYHDKIKLEVI